MSDKGSGTLGVIDAPEEEVGKPGPRRREGDGGDDEQYVAIRATPMRRVARVARLRTVSLNAPRHARGRRRRWPLPAGDGPYARRRTEYRSLPRATGWWAYAVRVTARVSQISQGSDTERRRRRRPHTAACCVGRRRCLRKDACSRLAVSAITPAREAARCRRASRRAARRCSASEAASGRCFESRADHLAR